jgi:hypothetical protein
MWQELIVSLCVLLAVTFLLRQYMPGLRKSGGSCHHCQGCDNKKSSGGCGTN